MLVGAKEPGTCRSELFGRGGPHRCSRWAVIGICARTGTVTSPPPAPPRGPGVHGHLDANGGPAGGLAPELGNTPGFFQLYTPNDRDLAVSLVQRAEAAGSAASSSPSTP